MTHFLTFADHYGTAVHVIGFVFAMASVGMIAAEFMSRSRRQRRNAELLAERTTQVKADAVRTRPAA